MILTTAGVRHNLSDQLSQGQELQGLLCYQCNIIINRQSMNIIKFIREKDEQLFTAIFLKVTLAIHSLEIRQ